MKNVRFLVPLILLLLGTSFYLAQKKESVRPADIPPAQEYEDFVRKDQSANSLVDNLATTTAPDGTDKPPGASSTAPAVPIMARTINLAVPFTSQAPSGDWAQPWQDACEEASVLMVDYYLRGEALPERVALEKSLLAMVKWQEANWGGHYNLSLAKLAEFIASHYNYRVEIIANLSASKIREYLNQGLPMIVPADGHILDNPYFSGDGPDYHMLVIKGYVGDDFITNDPGTRRGKDFVYSSDNLLSAIYDWDEQKSQARGPKRGLIIYKK